MTGRFIPTPVILLRSDCQNPAHYLYIVKLTVAVFRLIGTGKYTWTEKERHDPLISAHYDFSGAVLTLDKW